MFLLAFESSCDDTSVALLKDGELVSMHTHTQLEHIKTLGVVPEIAARLHADHIFELIEKVLADAFEIAPLGRGVAQSAGGLRWESVDEKGVNLTLNEKFGNERAFRRFLANIDVFAATSEPGLVPSLLIGKTVAKTLAKVYKKPLIWVNHIEGHIFSILLGRKLEDIRFPVVVLSASGGHNDLFLWNSLYEIEKIGQTTDDSAGETMDKVGRSLGLPFPAGRYIDELAQKYNPTIHNNIPKFPIVLPEGSLNFSFSGLKSAALREIEKRASPQPPPKEGELELGWSTADKALYTHLLEYQKQLKKKPTGSEEVLWKLLRNKKTGFKFRRQHIIGYFIADYVCLPLKTVIEVDGNIHDTTKEYDDIRTKFLEEKGFSVMRFTNEEVLKDPKTVTNTIKQYLDAKQTQTVPVPPPSEGDRGRLGELGEADLIEISYGYQKTIVEILSRRLIEAFEHPPSFGGGKGEANSIALVGGVSANSALRKIMEDYSLQNAIPYYTPISMRFCGDNAAMIGVRAYWEWKRNQNKI